MQESVLVEVMLPIVMAFIMFGMGITLEISDFKRVMRYPRAAFFGVFGQMILLPTLGFATAAFFAPDPIIAVGIILVAACPGGTTSNLICHLARGNTALSISLTAISSLITLVSIPSIVSLALSVFKGSSNSVSLPLGYTLGTLFAIVLAPVSLGMIFRHFKPLLARRLEGFFSALGGLFMVALVVGIIADEWDNLPSILSQAGPATLALNFSAVAMGFTMAKIFDLARRDVVTLAIEVGIQNSTLAMLIALSILKEPKLAVPAAAYSLMMYASAAFLIYLGRSITPIQTLDRK
jgi:BASS family bile acid:Na+ symporter